MARPASPSSATPCAIASTVPPAVPTPLLSTVKLSTPSPPFTIRLATVLHTSITSSPAPAFTVTLLRPGAASVGLMMIVSARSPAVSPAFTTKSVLLANSTGSNASTSTQRRPSPMAIPSVSRMALAASVALMVRASATVVSTMGSRPV